MNIPDELSVVEPEIINLFGVKLFPTSPSGNPETFIEITSEQLLLLNDKITSSMAVPAITVCDRVVGFEVTVPVILQLFWLVISFTWLTIPVNGFVLDAVWDGTVPLVVAVAGLMSMHGLDPKKQFEVGVFEILFPERKTELLCVGWGTLLMLVGGGVLGSKVIRLKLSDEDEVVLKFKFVNAPNPPITIVVLLSVVNLEKIWVVWLFNISVNKIFKRMSMLIKILPFDFAVSSSRSSNSHSPTRSLAVW